jgi:uncharacterized protein YjiS (DUF1127 family)
MESAMFAWLADLSEALRVERMRHRAMRDLARMDDAALADIGIEPAMIGTVAEGMAARHAAEEQRRRAWQEAQFPIGTRPVHCG